MNILLNGENHEIPEACTAAALVEQLDLAGKRIAMEVNLDIVPRSEYVSFQLNEGDKVEIVNAIGGG